MSRSVCKVPCGKTRTDARAKRAGSCEETVEAENFLWKQQEKQGVFTDPLALTRREPALCGAEGALEATRYNTPDDRAPSRNVDGKAS